MTRAEQMEAQQVKAARRQMEESRDQLVQALIIDKRTGDIIDRKNDLRNDNSVAWAQKQIKGHAHLKYQIISVV